MASTASPAVEMIPQLEAARKLALGDPQVYNQVLPGILPVIGPNAPLDVRRWGADFLAESFANPSLPNTQKENLTTEVLPTLRIMLENAGEDVMVVKSVIQAASSIYPLVFRRVISQPDQALIWQDMTAVKLNILQRMESSPTPVRICCIKFIQKVIQVETPGLITDPRRPEHNETSIALVPRNHPLLPLQNLEAEASGLLDRLLTVFQENSSDPIMIDATLNCLAIMIRSRPAIANKVISAILNFNPLKQANAPMTPRLMVIIKSMERTTRALLRHVLRTMPNNHMEQKIQSYLMKMQQSRMTLFAEAPSLKRAAEPTDGLDEAKRQRLTGEPPKYPSMPPPPNSVAHLFTLTEDIGLQNFDVTLLPTDIVTNVAAVLLQHVDSNALDEAIGVIRSRYTHLQKASQPTPVPDVPMAGPTGIDDEDDYDPEFATGSEQTVAPALEKALEELAQPTIDLGAFELSKPPPLTDSEVIVLSEQTIGHIYNIVTSLDAGNHVPARQKLGLNRLAASSNDRDAWITILSRLATRSSAGLDELITSESSKNETDAIVKSEPPNPGPDEPSIANRIRQVLFMYISDDFRPRLNIAISWLTEEWYADKLNAKTNPKFANLPNYKSWSLRLIDRLLPYLDAKDKNLLIRFLSEIPAIDVDMLERIKSLSRDPERVNMCILALQYLLMMRPPVRELVLDTVESIWREGDVQIKAATAKILNKWRPGVVTTSDDIQQITPKVEQKEIRDTVEEDVKVNGLKSPSPAETFDPTRNLPTAVTAGNGG